MELSIEWLVRAFHSLFKPQYDKTNKMACAPSEDSDQPGHPPNLIRVFAVRMKKLWILSYKVSAQRRLWSECADVQTDLSLHWAHRSFCWFSHGAALFIYYPVLALAFDMFLSYTRNSWASHHFRKETYPSNIIWENSSGLRNQYLFRSVAHRKRCPFNL